MRFITFSFGLAVISALVMPQLVWAGGGGGGRGGAPMAGNHNVGGSPGRSAAPMHYSAPPMRYSAPPVRYAAPQPSRAQIYTQHFNGNPNGNRTVINQNRITNNQYIQNNHNNNYRYNQQRYGEHRDQHREYYYGDYRRPQNWAFHDSRWHPAWWGVGIVISPFIYERLPWIEAGWWQCTAVSAAQDPDTGIVNQYSERGGGPTLQDAQYNALLSCGNGNADYTQTGCYIPPGYCRRY